MSDLENENEENITEMMDSDNEQDVDSNASSVISIELERERVPDVEGFSVEESRLNNSILTEEQSRSIITTGEVNALQIPVAQLVEQISSFSNELALAMTQNRVMDIKEMIGRRMFTEQEQFRIIPNTALDDVLIEVINRTIQQLNEQQLQGFRTVFSSTRNLVEPEYRFEMYHVDFFTLFHGSGLLGLRPIDWMHVQNLIQECRKGAKFMLSKSPIYGYRRGNNIYVIDGNHRMAAFFIMNQEMEHPETEFFINIRLLSSDYTNSALEAMSFNLNRCNRIAMANDLNGDVLNCIQLLLQYENLTICTLSYSVKCNKMFRDKYEPTKIPNLRSRTAHMLAMFFMEVNPNLAVYNAIGSFLNHYTENHLDFLINSSLYKEEPDIVDVRSKLIWLVASLLNRYSPLPHDRDLEYLAKFLPYTNTDLLTDSTRKYFFEHDISGFRRPASALQIQNRQSHGKNKYSWRKERKLRICLDEDSRQLKIAQQREEYEQFRASIDPSFIAERPTLMDELQDLNSNLKNVFELEKSFEAQVNYDPNERMRSFDSMYEKFDDLLEMCEQQIQYDLYHDTPNTLLKRRSIRNQIEKIKDFKQNYDAYAQQIEQLNARDEAEIEKQREQIQILKEREIKEAQDRLRDQRARMQIIPFDETQHGEDYRAAMKAKNDERDRREKEREERRKKSLSRLQLAQIIDPTLERPFTATSEEPIAKRPRTSDPFASVSTSSPHGPSRVVVSSSEKDDSSKQAAVSETPQVRSYQRVEDNESLINASSSLNNRHQGVRLFLSEVHTYCGAHTSVKFIYAVFKQNFSLTRLQGDKFGVFKLLLESNWEEAKEEVDVLVQRLLPTRWKNQYTTDPSKVPLEYILAGISSHLNQPIIVFTFQQVLNEVILTKVEEIRTIGNALDRHALDKKLMTSIISSPNFIVLSICTISNNFEVNKIVNN